MLRGMARVELRSWPIPSGLNLVVTALVVVGQLSALALATHGGGLGATALAALLYGTLGQPAFALLHEAEHGKLHPNVRVNEALGVLLGAMFPGSFSILRAAHLLHHRRNRSEEEMIDLYRPGERLKKTLSYYALISGLIWVGSPLLALALCVLHWPKAGPATPDGWPRNIRLAEFLSFLEGSAPGPCAPRSPSPRCCGRGSSGRSGFCSGRPWPVSAPSRRCGRASSTSTTCARRFILWRARLISRCPAG
ncbi:MAG: fatty acid desaturase [Deltaproteobacteria bacterium]|nr:fatty acid desaturase [Deltaproteobacteria bacterium]